MDPVLYVGNLTSPLLECHFACLPNFFYHLKTTLSILIRWQKYTLRSKLYFWPDMDTHNDSMKETIFLGFLVCQILYIL